MFTIFDCLSPLFQKSTKLIYNSKDIFINVKCTNSSEDVVLNLVQNLLLIMLPERLKLIKALKI